MLLWITNDRFVTSEARDSGVPSTSETTGQSAEDEANTSVIIHDTTAADLAATA